MQRGYHDDMQYPHCVRVAEVVVDLIYLHGLEIPPIRLALTAQWQSDTICE